MRILSSASSNLCLLLVLIAYSTAPLQADGEMSLTNFAASFDPVFATLLTQPEVQEELEISKSQSEELFAVLTKYRDEWRKHAETFTKQVETSAKLEAGKEPISLKNLRLMNQEYSGKILAILQPKQRDRFLEIYLRTRTKTDTASVLLLAIVRDKLKLADEQVEQLEKIQKKAIASTVKSLQDGREAVKGIKGTSIESLRELKKAVSRMQEKQQTSIKDSSVEALKVLNEEQNTTFVKMQGPAVPIKIAENSLDKDAELIKLNKTNDSVEQMIQIWKSAPLTELEQVYSVLLQGAKLTDEKRNAQVKQFENQLKQNQEKRLQLMRVDDPITPKIAGNPDPKPVPKFTGAKAGERLVLKVLGIDVPLRWCPAGSFTMGSPPSEADRSPDEDQVEVKLTRGFWMLETEVTQELWTAVMGTTIEQQNAKVSTTSLDDGVGPKYPMCLVSHDEAVKFCGKLTTLGRAAGLPADFQMHLPSEAQWEYACRAGTTSATAFGNSLSSEQANFAGNFPYGGAAKGPVVEKATEVGSYKANAWGLFDMHGNVCEWCADWYVEKLPGGQDPQVVQVVQASSASIRVIRGGCWHLYGVRCRAASRDGVPPDAWRRNLGFRPACSFFVKAQGPAVPIKSAENSLDKDAELFKLNKTIDSVPQVDESDLIGPVFTKNEAKIAQKVLADTLKSPIDGHIKLSDKTQMNMVLIPAGKTIFGTGKDGSDDFEEIDILFPFYMGKFEVTVDQFRTYAKETGYKTDAEKSRYGHGFNESLNKLIDGESRSEGDENNFYWGYTGFELQGSSPVVNLTVNDMNSYVLWLRKKTGLYLDFPTPREWTYAAKAGVGTKYNWGDDFQNFEKHANFQGIGTDKRKKVLTPVGSFEPNAFGLHDVLGNVWEICKNDKAEPDWYYGMGGSFFSKQKCCQLGHYHNIDRNHPENTLNLNSYGIGFRLIIRLSDNKN